MPQYQALMKREGFDIAAFEFIVDAQGRDYTYDINQNTNYNPAAEAPAGLFGMSAIADCLGEELRNSRS